VSSAASWSYAAVVILIDPPQWWHRERWWGHMVSDLSFEELHEFAAALGVPRRGFERDHYDIPDHLHAPALAAGAVLVPSKELVVRLTAAGLRRPKGRDIPLGTPPVQ
jgi:hypothetical protein